MTDNIQRQPTGVPVRSQHAPMSHAGTALNLASGRPELDVWPESLPEPEVSFEGITTTISISGEPVFEVWNPADDIYSTDNASFVHDLTQDEDVHDAAQEWA
jgi:hypothetical protein